MQFIIEQKKINGFVVDHFWGFGFDGCHKIYLFKNAREQKELKRLGYTLFALDKGLIQCYLDSCPLRFIQTYGGKDDGKYVRVVDQGCGKVVFEGFDDIDKLDLETNTDLEASIEDGKVVVYPLESEEEA